MASRKIPQVRPQSRNTGHERIRNLKCYPEMYSRLLDGWPLPEVAKFIQEIKKESLDITPGGLVAALTAFRSDIPPNELTKKRIPQAFFEAAEEVLEGLDELREFEKLYRIQMKRIEIDFTHEKKINKLMNTTGQEMRIAREVLSAYADLKMSLGLSKRHLGKMEVEAKILTDVAIRYENAAPDVAQVMNNPQSRHKILGLVEKLLAKSAAQAVGDSPNPQPVVIDVEGHPPTTVSDVDSDLFPELNSDDQDDAEEVTP